jgi:MFS family permease
VVLASNWKSFCWYCGWNRQVAFLYSKRRRHYLFGCSLLSSRRDGIAATVVVPIYFSEISPIEVRGAVGTMHQVGITFGILVSQALSTPSLHLLGSDELWKWLFLVPVICGVVELAVLPFCPESPSYLYVTKGEKEARDALIRLQSWDVADKYLEYIKEEIEVTTDGGRNIGVFELFADESLRKQLLVGITVQLMMQFSGIDAIFYYSTQVFSQADVADPALATTCLGVINVIVTIFAARWMDSAGRKTLLTYSWIGMCTSYIILTLSFVFKPYASFMAQVSIISMTGVTIFFAFGPGCIAWFIIAEIFPINARDTAMAIGICINWVRVVVVVVVVVSRGEILNFFLSNNTFTLLGSEFFGRLFLPYTFGVYTALYLPRICCDDFGFPILYYSLCARDKGIDGKASGQGI